MRKLIFRCGLAPGDIVLLTAAVRDLHLCYPGQFCTDVRTSCAEMWNHNPYLTCLAENDPEVTTIDCKYPLINSANYAPYHAIHGFVEFLSKKLCLSIRPTAFKGDLHLSPQEKAWFSQVQEYTETPIPFWIVAAGGKYDVPIKWWSTERYQEVINHFRGRIQFVQVGKENHHHPKLQGAIDLRGLTSVRELIRLVYHSQGVLCSVTAVMHLAAAVEVKPDNPRSRGCVVIAGGREPAHWEAYPDHQFIHTNGTLPCCAAGGCWRDRVVPLRDGDKRDSLAHRCVDLKENLPHCMHMIQPSEVIRRIERYFEGSYFKYLSHSQKGPAKKGLKASQHNHFDSKPLDLHSAGMAFEQRILGLSDYSPVHSGRGVVICGGGQLYFQNAWVCIHMLRFLGCKLDIELWYLGEKEWLPQMAMLHRVHGVKCIDALSVQKSFPVRRLGGWELKPYSILNSRFRDVLFLDADNVPVQDPSSLFDNPAFLKTGAIFWPDYPHGDHKNRKDIWRSCGLRKPQEPEFESGQMLINKAKCWKALQLSMWFNEHSDFYYKYIYGDKETFHLAFRKMKKRYTLIPYPIHTLEGTMCQHDLTGRRLFQHRNTLKWKLCDNKRVSDFWFEKECLGFLMELYQATTIPGQTGNKWHQSKSTNVSRMSAS